MVDDEPATPAGDGGLVRLRLEIGYDGTDFSGWAVQPGRRTVQGVLEDGLTTLFRPGRAAAVERVRLTVAGRTDTGVHASGQVAHCDVPLAEWITQQDKGIRRLAGLLPADVRVADLRPAAPGFDARFSAVWRSYRYRISDADFGVDPMLRHVVVAWRRRLDAEVMQQAATPLLGLHNFTAFCRRRDFGTAIRTLQRCDVKRNNDVITVAVQADAFCHSMVRSLVGALAAVGAGQRPIDWPASLLDRDTRSDEITVAPAHGLTLIDVGYPPDDQLAARAEQTRAVRPGLDRS